MVVIPGPRRTSYVRPRSPRYAFLSNAPRSPVARSANDQVGELYSTLGGIVGYAVLRPYRRAPDRVAGRFATVAATTSGSYAWRSPDGRDCFRHPRPQEPPSSMASAGPRCCFTRTSSSGASCCTVLPKGFHRIRHYGLFASTNRAESIATARALLNVVPFCRRSPTRAGCCAGCIAGAAVPMSPLRRAHDRYQDLRMRLRAELATNTNQNRHEQPPKCLLGPANLLFVQTRRSNPAGITTIIKIGANIKFP
jgi:hypothetical protein